MIANTALSDAQAAAARTDRAEFVCTEFLDRVAHELRGPAGVTLGALDEIELALGSAAEHSRPFLAMARRGAYKILRTADRLTRTAQLEAGVKLQLAATDLRLLVRQAGMDALRAEERANVRLEVLLADVPCPVRVDADWVQAAITELISHAVHSARSVVSVHVTSERVLVIRNDGVSHSAALHTQRFEPEASRRDAGLALPLAREVAHAHGGTFLIASTADGMDVKISFGRVP